MVTFPLSLYHFLALAFTDLLQIRSCLYYTLINKEPIRHDLIHAVTKDHLKRNSVRRQLSLLKLPVLYLAAVRCLRNSLEVSPEAWGHTLRTGK